MGNYSKYWKTIIAVFGGLVSFLIVVILSDPGPIQNEEWALLLTEIATAVGIFSKKNET